MTEHVTPISAEQATAMPDQEQPVTRWFSDDARANELASLPYRHRRLVMTLDSMVGPGSRSVEMLRRAAQAALDVLAAGMDTVHGARLVLPDPASADWHEPRKWVRR